MKDRLFTFIKGMLVGGTMLVPGVSGGSMAMILGVYDRLVSAVSRFMKQKKESIIFLTLFAAGGLIGMILFAKPILSLIELYPKPSLYFFIGCVAGGLPMIVKKAGIKKLNWRSLLYPVIGALLVLVLALIPTQSAGQSTQTGIISFIFLMLSGFITAAALVLPGISVSFFLLLLGMYDETMKAISEFYLPFLIPLGIGLLLGIILTTKLLERAMSRFPQATYLIIFGFVLGSIAQIFPGLPQSIIETAICIVTLISGYMAIWLLSRLENRISQS